jgi:hypothetical protein
MKKIFLMALVFVAPALFAQNFASVQYKTLKFYNTAGTQATKGAHTTGVSAVIDTFVSEFIPFDGDEYKFSISAGAGDTLYALVGYQLVSGVNPLSQPTNAGFYTRGNGLVVAVDSIASLGVRQAIVANTARVFLSSSFIPTGHTSTAGGYQSNRDSTWTNTFGGLGTQTLASMGYCGFRIVLRLYAGVQDVNNTTIFNQNVLVIKRLD